MITRRAILSAPMTLPVMAHAAAVQIDYDIVPTAIRTPEAISYAAADWTNIAYANVFGTCFTCHTRTFNPGLRPLVNGSVRLCLGGTGQVRLVSFYYDTNNNQIYDRTWAPPFQCPPGYGVSNQGAYIAGHFNDVIIPNPAQSIFTLEVNGTGLVYLARLELEYS